MIVGVVCVVAAFVFTLPSFGQQQPDYSKVQIKVQKVSGIVYMLEGLGGNIGASVGDDGIVVIDDEFLPLASRPARD